MNEEEFKKQQRREINRRAYLKRIGGNVKNYSKNSNDDNYINFLEKTKKIEKNEKDLFWSKHQKEESESDEESIRDEDNNIHYDVNDNRNKTDLNYYLNPDNMRQRDKIFEQQRQKEASTRKAVDIAKTLYPQYF